MNVLVTAITGESIIRIFIVISEMIIMSAVIDTSAVIIVIVNVNIDVA